MRKLVVGSILFLALSGILLHYRSVLQEITGFSAMAALHLWCGMFFIVIFPMYAWDHIRRHRQRLQRVSGIACSGVLQLISGVILIVTGIILFAYGEQALPGPTQWHWDFTFVLLGSLALHSFFKRKL